MQTGARSVETIAWYERCGYQVVAKNVDGAGIDVMVLEKAS
jgi:hypothetical protein